MPQLQGDATEQTPPDLPSYLFKERIVYLVRFRFPLSISVHFLVLEDPSLL